MLKWLNMITIKFKEFFFKLSKLCNLFFNNNIPKMNDLILFGMQGSGKGTQAKILAKKFGYKIFETGAELRIVAESDTPLGKKVKDIMNQGKLVDTSIIMEIVEEFCRNLDNDKHAIFDGIPRNMEQYKLFEAVMAKMGKKPTALNIKLTNEEAMGRLLKRFTCVGVDTTHNPLITEEECIAMGGTIKRRSDDNEDVIKTRIEAFLTETQPVIEEYRKENRLKEVKGLQSVEEVTGDLVTILE